MIARKLKANMTRQHYKTKQREAILSALRKNAGNHITAQTLAQTVAEDGYSTSVATVYRTLMQLEGEGKVHKMPDARGHAACYEYVGDQGDHDEPACFHCLCRECGKLIHLHCDELSGIREHIEKEHGFRIDPWQTVFYGTCEECLAKHED
ncbi:transcriptional regulator, Fur family [Atopobium sp. oral taxon 810 str. F0209]|nr:transcriptional regulator, Fur family [Atopobium sp. oral taxon 810 str. F0209]